MAKFQNPRLARTLAKLLAEASEPGPDLPAAVPDEAHASAVNRALRGSAFTSYERIGSADDGAVVVTREGSDLTVGGAPLAELGLLLDRPEFASAVYVLAMQSAAGLTFGWFVADADGAAPPDGSVPDGDSSEDGDATAFAAKYGESVRTALRLGKHLRRPPVASDWVWLVGSVKRGGFGKDRLLALQQAMTHQAIRAGRCRVFGAPPEESWLAGIDPGLMAVWLSDVREMLPGAGCYLLEPPGAWIRPAIPVQYVDEPSATAPDVVVDPVPPVRRRRRTKPALVPLRAGYRLVLAGSSAAPGARRYVLAWREVRATALVTDEGAVLIEAGSVFSARQRSGVQPCIARKLARMEMGGLFRPTEGEARRLNWAVQVSSLTNAARLATNSNRLGKAMWRPVA